MQKLIILLGFVFTCASSAPAQRIAIETNEKHNISHAEWRVKGSPVATTEVAGVKITYPQIAVNPIPGFTTVGGNIKTEFAHGEIRVGLAEILKQIGTFETTRKMRVLDAAHKSQTIDPGKYHLGFEYQPNQKIWALQLSKDGGEVVANVPIFLKEGNAIIEALAIDLSTMPGKTVELKKNEEFRYEPAGIRLIIRWGDLEGTTMNISFSDQSS